MGGRICSTSAPFAGESMVGAGGPFGGGGGGTLVSIVNVIDTDALTLPTASCWETETVYVPSDSAEAVQVHFPPAFTDAWQIVALADAGALPAETVALVADTVTTAPASPVPVNTGRFTFVGLGIWSTVGVPIDVFTTNTSGFDAGTWSCRA
jgi:hypothetical protein